MRRWVVSSLFVADNAKGLQLHPAMHLHPIANTVVLAILFSCLGLLWLCGWGLILFLRDLKVDLKTYKRSHDTR